MSHFSCFGNQWLKNCKKKTILLNKYNVLTINLSKWLTLNKYLEGFFTSICNVTIMLQNWRISWKRGFDSEVLLSMCPETIIYCVKLPFMAEAYLEPYQISETELFVKIVNGFRLFVNYFCKTLHLKIFAGFWIRLCMVHSFTLVYGQIPSILFLSEGIKTMNGGTLIY